MDTYSLITECNNVSHFVSNLFHFTLEFIKFESLTEIDENTELSVTSFASFPTARHYFI